ncbi:hypothetical protein [Qipengyuania gelatinilytica]|uniref:asparagine synthase (glutamine-hydrolyzing) n=1 Tax=Qipengyuania gelatinilytica TaxID=2867231 RepID=A0ABX8ZYE7_9SPHN|nr:hypothetical protein [Qipengyuania gelatinilytica]QZD94050.1 hypothetical protein K3136_07970 [Qipengyuania gelatinilytica]
MSEALERYDRKPAQVLSGSTSIALAASRDHVGNSGGTIAAFTGWIDNAAELTDLTGIAPDNSAHLYAACVTRWGEDADRRIVGSYAAAAHLPDGTLHLARSPWDAPPLYYHHAEGRIIASPLLRVLFAAGAPREPDYDRVIDELAYDFRSGDEQSWYRDILMVPLGAHVRIKDGVRQVTRWYQPPEPMKPADYDEDAAVEKARTLLDEAASRAAAWASRPAMALSGGLDSTLVADALLRVSPEREKLDAITFVPDRNWQGKCEPGTMGDERPFAGLMAQANPRIDWHIADDDHGPHDRRARDVFAASETFAPGLANVGMYHNVYAKARELGCDALLTADFGNVTISDAGRSAYAEYARAGEWKQLLRLLNNRPGDGRPLWRKLAALSVLPHLPRALRQRLRSLAHPERTDMTALITPLSPEAREKQAARARARGSQGAWSDLTHDLDRAGTVAREWRDADGPGRDVDLAFEQLYGVRKRDVLTYRPLVEFCMSLPTRAFAWDGEERRLARLMGKGRVPEAIRTNRLHGQHNVDWHARMTPAREDMMDLLERARDHPFLGRSLDIERLQRLIEDWPEGPDFSWENDYPRRLALPRAILAARFIGHVENRNEF